MKSIKIVSSVFIVFLTSVSWGQNAPLEHKNEPSRNTISSKEMVKLNQIYFEETELLKSYFVKGEVKNGFPGYNQALSKGDNVNEIKKWLALAENKQALTKEGLEAIELYTKSK
jgi:hypothetical protein